jgi:hypothetical protein
MVFPIGTSSCGVSYICIFLNMNTGYVGHPLIISSIKIRNNTPGIVITGVRPSYIEIRRSPRILWSNSLQLSIMHGQRSAVMNEHNMIYNTNGDKSYGKKHTFARLWYYSPWIANICHVEMVANKNCCWRSWSTVSTDSGFSSQEICVSLLIGLTCELSLVIWLLSY